MKEPTPKTYPFGMSKQLYRLNAGMGLALFFIVALTALVIRINAASILNKKDSLSNQTTSGTATHTVTFNLSGGNTFATGEQIAFDLPQSSAFTQGGTWTTSDFSFSDGTARTIDAVNAGAGITTVACADGANNVGVAIDTTALTFRVIPCGASFTASGAGAFITFTISGQAPNGTLTNPAVAGSYTVSVLNAGGDCTGGSDDCRMAVAIVDSNDVTISATVTSSSVCGNSVIESGETCDDGNVIGGDGCSATCQTEGGGGPPPDTTPPVISSITVTGITGTGATINWSTNESADSTVNYGVTITYGSQETNGSLLLSHSMNLTGLTGGTLYHYQVCSRDASNNQACSGDGTFTTLDTTPPNISSVVVSGITETGATITWTTDENASSFVDYALTAGPPYANTAGTASPLVTSHSVTLTGLTASTTYHYRVRSGDASSNESFTANATFTTASPADVTPPVISSITVTGITATSATVNWTTNEPATRFVDYGLTPSYGSTSGTATPLQTSHSVTLTGLTENTTYNFRVRSADGVPNEAASGNQTFQTLDATAPIISAVTVSAITGTSATVTWTTNEPASNFVDYGLTPSYGSTAGTATPLQTSHSVNLTGLTPSTTYNFRVRSADAASNEATSTNSTFQTLDTTPPIISAVTVSGITTTSATITWTTNEPATRFVDYGLTPSYGSTSGTATPLQTSHSVTLTGLTPSTVYNYRVRSADAASNSASSTNATFTTLTPPDTTPPVISSVTVTGLSATSATITWTTDEPATRFVDYGLTPSYGSTAGTATPLQTSHSVTLTGLTSETTYNYRVRSADAVGNSASSANATFTTIDVNAPVISSISVSAITETTATVTWTTNENATNFVDYGTVAGPPYANTAGTATPRVTSHTVNLTGLTANTTYHYRVRSADIDNNESVSSNATFTTLDSTAPIISAVSASAITQTSATITWTTNEGSDSVVDYGPTISYGSTQTDGTSVTSHSINLTGLTPATTYNYRVKSKDAANNQATSGNFTFATLAPPPPNISGITVSNVTQTSVRVTWTTDVVSDSKVDFGLTPSYGDVRSDATDVTSHQIDITGLTKNTTYNYRVRSEDVYAQESASSNATFQTAADVTPPANASPFTATAGNGSVSLSWTNPADPDFDRVAIRRKLGSNPTGPTDGDEIYNGSGTSFVDTGLVNGTTYFYGAFAYDDVPNFASGAFASATPTGPVDTTPPPNVSGFTVTPGNQQNNLTWTNPSDPDFVGVRVVRKTAGFPTGPGDGTIVYSGAGTTHLDTGLTNGVTYYYKAYSFDGPLNFSPGVEAQGTPVAPPDTTPPAAVTNFVASAGDTEVQLSWTNPSSPDWAGTRVVRKVGADPTGPNDGSIVFDGVGDNQLDVGLTNDTTYHYAAYAYDPSLNFAPAALANATPTEGAVPPPPLCSDTDGGRVYEVQGTVATGAGSFQDSCTDSRTLRENYCEAGAQKDESKDCGTGFKCSAGRCTPDVVTTEICGNGICGGSENSINCAIDCPVAPVQPPVEEKEPNVSEEHRLAIDDIEFLATSARVGLKVVNGGISAYRKMTIIVYLPDQSIRKPIKSAFVNFAGSASPMRPTRSYEASVVVPDALGNHPLSVIVNYEDGTNDAVNVTIIAVPRGRIYGTTDGEDVELSDARVTLLFDQGGGNFGFWNGAASGQQNPQQTDELGRYTFIVQPGTYKLVAEKEGYITRQTLAFPVTTNVITTDLRLTKVPENVQEQIGAAAQQTADQVKEIISNPIIEEQAQNVAAPAAAVAAVANVASAGAATATAVPYLLYVYSFFAHPTLLIARRRRQKWGVIYNSLTKLPVDLAIVRLLDAKTGRIVRSAVTDKDGRYFFIVQPGEYKMTAVKVGFVFPSAILKGAKEDVNFVDLYHGEVISVKEETTITANVPLDPVTVEKTPRKIMLEGIGRRLQKSLGVLSILAMIISAIITPTPIMIGLLVGNVVLYFVFRRLAIPPKPKNWGIVYDEKSGKPLQNVVARIFESKYNKLLETQVTDARGRYAFLVGNNIYYVTFEKPGYQKQQKGPLDLSKRDAKKKDAAEIVAVDVKLQPAVGGTPVAEKKSALPPPPPGLGGPKPPEAPPAAPAAPTPTAPAAPGPTAPTAAEPAKPAAPKMSWEQQMLARLKNAPGAASPATPAAAPGSAATPTPPATVQAQTPPPETPKAPEAPKTAESAKPAAPKMSWEQQMLARLKTTPGTKPPAAPPAPGAQTPPPEPPKPAPAEPPKATPAAGTAASAPKLIQDAEHAHPDIKLIEDAAHAHPDEQPKKDDGLTGPEDIIKDVK